MMVLQRVKIGSSRDKEALRLWHRLKRLQSEIDRLDVLISRKKKVLLDRFANPQTQEQKMDLISLQISLDASMRGYGSRSYGYSDGGDLLEHTSYPDSVKNEVRDINKLKDKAGALLEEKYKLALEYDKMVENIEYYE